MIMSYLVNIAQGMVIGLFITILILVICPESVYREVKRRSNSILYRLLSPRLVYYSPVIYGLDHDTMSQYHQLAFHLETHNYIADQMKIKIAELREALHSLGISAVEATTNVINFTHAWNSDSEPWLSLRDSDLDNDLDSKIESEWEN